MKAVQGQHDVEAFVREGKGIKLVMVNPYAVKQSNLRVHHSKAVAVWLEEHKEQIELFFLPPYAPEYNPDELLNSDLKRNAGAMQSPRSQLELENNVRSPIPTQFPHLFTSSFLFFLPCSSNFLRGLSS